MDELYITPSMSTAQRHRFTMVHRCVLRFDPFLAELTDSAVTLEDFGQRDCAITGNPEFARSMPLAKANLRLSVSTPDALKAAVNLAAAFAVSVKSIVGCAGFVKGIFLSSIWFMFHASYTLLHRSIAFFNRARAE